MRLPRLFVIALGLFVAPMVAAHEFWIEPLAYQVPVGGDLQADFKNGQRFEGNTLSFFDRSSTRFDLVAGSPPEALLPRNGDRPALAVPAPAEGLVVVVHEKAPALLTYRDWEKFVAFARHKDFVDAAVKHVERGWPQENFRERYTRHAKTLMSVGHGEGSDRALGLETEFIALTNPYADDFNRVMRVALRLNSTPRADAQVEVFARAPDGSVVITLHRTDAEGVVTVPVLPGYVYLFDAVVLRAAPEADPVHADAGEKPILWETLWAALTFAVPRAP